MTWGKEVCSEKWKEHSENQKSRKRQGFNEGVSHEDQRLRWVKKGTMEEKALRRTSSPEMLSGVVKSKSNFQG